MLETMYHAPGIGLAASQVGILTRIIVMDCEKEEAAKGKPIVMINPEIVASSDEENIYEEGCLSIPEHFAEIKRPTSVQVRWLDRNGNEQEQEFDGLWSTCVQHEIDHLNGKLFIDYLGTIKRQLITRKMQKFKREMERKNIDGYKKIADVARQTTQAKVQPVEKIDENVEKIWSDLIDTMEAMSCISLASSQLGIMSSLVVDASTDRGQFILLATQKSCKYRRK